MWRIDPNRSQCCGLLLKPVVSKRRQEGFNVLVRDERGWSFISLILICWSDITLYNCIWGESLGCGESIPTGRHVVVGL